MKKFEPRDYQTWAVNALWQYFFEKNGHPVIAAPTGVGKSAIIAMVVARMLAEYSRTRVLMMTHSQELIEQNYAKLLDVWPNAPAGIFSAGLGRKETQYPITYAGIKSISGNEHLFGHIDIILVDECDLVPDDFKSEYRRCIFALMAMNPKLKVIGLTATPWRTGVGLLTDGDTPLFTHIAVNMIELKAFNWFFDQGYLCRLTSKRTNVHVSAEGVGTSMGDYNKTQLEKQVNRAEVTEAAVREAKERAQGRRKWLVFTSGVKHAINTTEILNMLGVEARVVHSKGAGAKTQRQENIAWFRNYYKENPEAEGPIALVNNDILTTGFDDPEIDVILILRPTQSSRLWVQMLGRGTRPCYAEGFDMYTVPGRLLAIEHSQKPNCLVLDYARNSERLGPINDPLIPRKKGKGAPQPAPVKCCPNCDAYVHTSVRVCKEPIGVEPNGDLKLCGYEFPETVNIDLKAGTSDVQKDTEFPIITAFNVESVTYTIHRKHGAAPMVRVRYFTGLKSYDEFVCIEHPAGSYPRKKAIDWWRLTRMDESMRVPETIDEFLMVADYLKAPTHILVHVNKKYPEIMKKCFDGSKFGQIPIESPGALQRPEVAVTHERVHNTNHELELKPEQRSTLPQMVGFDDFDDDIPF